MKLYIRSTREFDDGIIKHFTELTNGQQERIIKQSISQVEESSAYQRECQRYDEDIDIYEFTRDMLFDHDPECIIYKGRKKAELLDVIF